MKLIIAGATGRIGGAALQNALSNPSITEIVVLSRRDINIQHPKLQTVIKTNYLQYSPEELTQLKGSEACIWYNPSLPNRNIPLTHPTRALGAPTSNPEIHIHYPLAARLAFGTSLAPHTPSRKPFRFILLSGAAIVRDQSTRLPPGLSILKQRGQLEQDFVDFEVQNDGIWKSFVARPRAVVLPGSWVGWAIPESFQILTEVLGAALVGVAVMGEGEQTLDNAALVKIGKAAMGRE
jgi:hypothetical protein